MTTIFIPGNVPSSKNSRQIMRAGGRIIVGKGKLVRDYERDTALIYANECKKFVKAYKGKDYPLRPVFSFVRSTKRRFDWINAMQIVQDLMVKHGWLPDDSTDYLMPVPGEVTYDKTNPGVIIY